MAGLRRDHPQCLLADSIIEGRHCPNDFSVEGNGDLAAMAGNPQPLDIANAILFLSSDMSSYMTGQIFSVSGGYSTVG